MLTVMDDRKQSWTPAGQADRYDPLPSLLRLPTHGWRKLSRRGRLIVVAIVLTGTAALVASWPQVEREKRAGEARRAQEAAERHAERRRELIEDQRPRRSTLPADTRARMRMAGGLTSPAAAHMAGTRLEAAIARDVRSRIAAGDLPGPLLETTCSAVQVRAPRGAGYNCFALTNSTRVGERVLESGYRFSAYARLPSGALAWCKENPRPLHPTSYVMSIPISPECR